MSQVNKKHIPYIQMSALSAYVIDKNYWIIINDNDTIQKMVRFSEERKCIQIQNLTLIKSNDIDQFLNMGFEQVKDIIGQPHVDIGSGFYIPSYITEDAYLICFEIENEMIFEVIKRDLFTNEIVERVNTGTGDGSLSQN